LISFCLLILSDIKPEFASEITESTEFLVLGVKGLDIINLEFSVISYECLLDVVNEKDS